MFLKWKTNISLLVITILVLSFFLIKHLFSDKTGQIGRDNQKLDALFEGANHLRHFWTNGDYEGKYLRGEKTCKNNFGNLKEIWGDYLKCNPEFIKCILENEFPLTIKNFTLVPLKNAQGNILEIVSKSLQNLEGAPNYGVKMSLALEGEIGKNTLSFVLEDNCQEILLPERTYAFGPFKMDDIEKDFKWDNVGRKIYADRRMVSIRDIIEWADATHLENLISSKLREDSKLWPFPATFLTVDNMRKYCAFKGKKVLSAHVYDAFTFIPFNLDNKFPKRIYRSPYPWSKKSNDAWPYKMKKYDDYQITDEDCKNCYSQECVGKISINEYFKESVSWAGLFGVLGGIMEYLENPIHPRENLKASSKFFTGDSDWHALGIRAFWDGQGHNINHFDFSNKSPKNESEFFEVGFRCMKEIVKND